MITAKELYTLARSEHACDSALRRLRWWLKDNPAAPAADYFSQLERWNRSQCRLPAVRLQNGELDSCSVYDAQLAAGWIRWAFLHLLDWGTPREEKETARLLMGRSYGFYLWSPRDTVSAELSVEMQVAALRRAYL